MCNLPPLINLHLRLHRAYLSRIITNLTHLRQGLSGGLSEEGLNNRDFNQKPADVNAMRHLLDLINADADAVSLTDHSNVKQQEVETRSFRPC
jgi:hypothetical protein